MRLVLRPVPPRAWLLAGVALLPLLIPAAGAARVIGDVVSAGFNARGAGIGGRHVVRLGHWTPVVVQLTLEGQTQFEGRLRVAQRDRDGDVGYDYHEILLNADSAASRTYTLYTLPSLGADGAIDLSVELVDQDDVLVEMVSAGRLVRALRAADTPTVLPDDETLILDVAEGQMGKVARLAETGPGLRPLRPINVAHLAPRELPDRWQGLEAADAIVWDESDPDALNADQRQALAEWTRQGGVLVLATARHAAALQKSDVFGPLLPVTVGERTSLKEAGRFRSRWLGLPEEDAEYAEAVPLVKCSVRKGAGARRVFPEPGAESSSAGVDTLIARGRAGRGVVVFVAASLRELLDAECNPTTFWRALLEIRLTNTENYPDDRPLYQPLEAVVAFAATGGQYMVFALLFVMAYIGLATFGSWSFLKSRGWEKHNWTVFAGVAVVASLLSITATQTIRGVGQKLHQLTVVEATAGESAASATAYFGLKTGTHSVLDVWLADDYARAPEPQRTDCFLRALPADKSVAQGGVAFADPGSYELRPATAELLRVPIRATLKQFEGRWRGQLRGGIDAAVRLADRTFTRSANEEQTVRERCFDESSTITNRLGVDLEDCFLFQPSVNRYEGGLNYMSPRSQNLTEIKVYALGALADGATVRPASLYTDQFGNRLTWSDWHRSLLDYQNAWGKRFAGDVSLKMLQEKGKVKAGELSGFQEALLMLTALSEYDETSTTLQHYSQAPILFSRERCRWMDLSEVLTKDMVLLVGFAKAPGPVSLCTRRAGSTRDYRRVAPEEAWTVYRVVIPVETN